MIFPLTQQFAREFAHEWVEAWNSHDLERVLGHYSAKVELTSPFVRRILGGETDTVRGLEPLRDYFRRALAMYPDLLFSPKQVYCGVRTIVVPYESVGGRPSAELMEFDDAGRVCRAVAHYSAQAAPV